MDRGSSRPGFRDRLRATMEEQFEKHYARRRQRELQEYQSAMALQGRAITTTRSTPQTERLRRSATEQIIQRTTSSTLPFGSCEEFSSTPRPETVRGARVRELVRSFEDRLQRSTSLVRPQVTTTSSTPDLPLETVHLSDLLQPQKIEFPKNDTVEATKKPSLDGVAFPLNDAVQSGGNYIAAQDEFKDKVNKVNDSSSDFRNSDNLNNSSDYNNSNNLNESSGSNHSNNLDHSNDFNNSTDSNTLNEPRPQEGPLHRLSVELFTAVVKPETADAWWKGISEWSYSAIAGFN